MDEQRSRAKADAAARKHGGADASAYREVLERTGLTDFLGYSDQRADATIVGLIVDHVGVPAATEGDEVEVMLDRTPFYAEGGGQQADTGRLFGDGFTIEITDVQTPVPGLSVHRGRVLHGEATLDAPVSAQIDVERRAAISRAHTATHLVHAGMRKALGDSAAQAGSLNAPGRLRFDFTSPEGAVPASVLADVEDEVNTVLLGDDEVRAFVTSMDEARKLGAVALFGEKYGDAVRIVEVGEYSRELCGGTHVGRSGPARPGQADGRGLHRVRGPPRRGPRRHRRLPVPGPRARAGQPARRAVPRPARGAARAHRRGRRPPARRGEGARDDPGPRGALLGRRRSSTVPRTSAGSRSSPPARPRAWAAATCARSPATCAGGCRPGRASSRSSRPTGTRSRSSSPPPRAPASAAWPPATWSRPSRPR